ncbi:hypothetical protein BTW08_06930 [Salinicola sp. MH3R3-1]|uniref:Wadjet anti-phage system protein JetD domain-containing protein n=1 Tax=Salinicola sp. MH3R3-1 TaxID=1928762 RepID=UPI00094E2E6F|nr:Wadjet anti-phage system protein JetD domain-containing protein [Salinicola sp. MH3R3-1]OLO08463.1 hypothetical protein BTW08_06930 [Salinicola sp. MH3R3-1]
MNRDRQMLNPVALALLEDLESTWRKTARLEQTPPRNKADTLAKRLLRENVCRSLREGRQPLIELYRCGFISLPQGGGETALSPLNGLNPLVCLTEAHVADLQDAMEAADPALWLTGEQRRIWNRALDGPLGDWSLEEQRRLSEGLRRLASDAPEIYELTAFQASARYLLGSSKLLGSFPLLARAFGIDTNRFARPVVRVLISSPDNPDSLLLIENPQSFDQACRCGLDRRVALVCSFGYGLSLAEALDRPDDVRLIGDGQSTPGLSDLLALPQPSYWGDLDPEGFRIYRRLKHSIPELALSALYDPMIDAMAAGVSHPLSQATGKRGQVGAEKARGLDQEYLEDGVIGVLAGQTILDARWPGHLRDDPERR